MTLPGNEKQNSSTSELINMKNVFRNTKGIGITSLTRSFIDSKTFCIQYALGGEKLQC